MASKVIYPLVAAIGIAAASGAAWWYQSRPAKSATGTEIASGGNAGTGAATAASMASPASGVQGAASSPASGASAPRAPAVEAAKVEVMKLTDDMQAVGSLRSRQGVVMRPEVSGRITQLNFRDGERVRKGQLLVQLDDQLPQAQVLQSQAELSIAQANHKRNQELVEQNFISKRSVDESSANLEVAQAKLALSRATAARLKILAPFDGIVGIRTANVGDYLKDGADVVNVEDIDAVFVDFRLPERFQNKVKKGQSAAVTLDALPGAKYVALVQAVDPLIDANGRSVGVRGCIDNRQLRLRPGMFARVTAVFGERERALVIPEEAIVPQGQRVVVFKVVDGANKDEKIVQRVEVKVGIRRPGRVEITEGISEGDLIVTAGQQRLQRDGMAVRVVDGARAVQRDGSPGGPPAVAASAAQGAASQASAPSQPIGTAMAAVGTAAGTGGGRLEGKPGAKPQAKLPEGLNPCLMGPDGQGGPDGARDASPRGPGAPSDSTGPSGSRGGASRPAAKS